MESCVILVGHGGVPSDCPPALVSECKRLGTDRRIRDWPRTPANDPYKAGLEAVGQALRRALPGRLVLEAYNEFCAPSLEQALAEAAASGARAITVITTMYTRGGVHSETEIPSILAAFRRARPDIEARYCWPFDPDNVGAFLAREVARAEGR